MKPIVLWDEELCLRRARSGEARLLARAVYESQPELEPFLPWATPDYDLEAARLFLDFAREEEMQGRGHHLSLFLGEQGTLVGGVGLMLRPFLQQAEIGYWVHSDQAGKGYCTRAASLLMGWGFAELGLRRIFLTCDVANAASRRVARKLGMRREGLLKEYLVCQGEPRDHELHAVLAREFDS